MERDCVWLLISQTSAGWTEVYLLAGVTLVWLFSTVCSFMSLHVVFLNEAHVALVTAKRLLSYTQNEKGEEEMIRTRFIIIFLRGTQ